MPVGRTMERQSHKKISAHNKVWFLYLDEKKLGPFSSAEIKTFFKDKKIHHKTLLWRSGMKNWSPLGGLVKSTIQTPKRIFQEKRKTARIPFQAKLVLTDQRYVTFGLCRDFSLCGMKVKAERLPSKVGDCLRMNISPTPLRTAPLRPFVAEAKVTRIISDTEEKFFCFQFSKLSESTQKNLQKFLGLVTKKKLS